MHPMSLVLLRSPDRGTIVPLATFLSFVRRFCLFLIRIYQRYLSPYKGFSCAYRVHTRHASCSQLGYRAVRLHGARKGLAILRQRTYLCGIAHRRYCAVPLPPRSRQAGFCDLGCDLPCDGPCDLPHIGGASRACDLLSCCDCGGCDWPHKRRERRNEEKYVHIPPNVSMRRNHAE
jgi:uncharacterized protein